MSRALLQDHRLEKSYREPVDRCAQKIFGFRLVEGLFAGRYTFLLHHAMLGPEHLEGQF